MKLPALVILTVFCCSVFQLKVSAEYDSSTKGKFRIEPSLFFGLALKGAKIGDTTGGEEVKIAGGEGGGGAIAFGYGAGEKVDIEVLCGARSCAMYPEVYNADSEFGETIILAGGKYKIPLPQNSFIKAGCGAGYLIPQKMTLLLGYLDDWEITYKPAVVFNVTLDYEKYIGKKTTISGGLRLSYGSFNVDSVRGQVINGYNVDWVDMDPAILRARFGHGDFDKLSAAGIDFIIAIKFGN